MSEEKMREALFHYAALQESEAGAVYQVEQIIGGVSYWLDVSKQLYDCETLCKKRTVLTAPQYAQAIETAAIMKCAEVCEKAAHGVAGAGIFAEAVRALIPQDGRTALESLLSQCRKEALLEAEAAHDHEDVLAPVGNSAYGEAYQDGWIAGAAAYREELRRMAESDKTTMEGEK